MLGFSDEIFMEFCFRKGRRESGVRWAVVASIL